MTNFIGKLLARISSEDGQALAEYGLILAFVAILAVAALVALGVAVGVPFSDFTGGLTS